MQYLILCIEEVSNILYTVWNRSCARSEITLLMGEVYRHWKDWDCTLKIVF